MTPLPHTYSKLPERKTSHLAWAICLPQVVILRLHVRALRLVTRSRWISLQAERGSGPRIFLECCHRSGHLEQQGTGSYAWVQQYFRAAQSCFLVFSSQLLTYRPFVTPLGVTTLGVTSFSTSKPL